MSKKGVVDVVLGLQRGDEGKGRVIDLLAGKHKIVARFNGGPNAGHTIKVGKHVVALHQIPSGIMYPKVINVIGNGTLLDPIKLLAEMQDLIDAGIKVNNKNLLISKHAHLISPYHVSLDEIREFGKDAQGSTKRGIAYAAADKYSREGIRAESLTDTEAIKNKIVSQLKEANVVRKKLKLPLHQPNKEAELWIASSKKLLPFLINSSELINQTLEKGGSVLAEGAQASSLDIDHGMYPFVTSSHTTVGGVLVGLGVNHKSIARVIGVVKAVKSHVGGGPFVTEITSQKIAEKVRGERGLVDSEFGASTGRARRIGYLDLPEIRLAIQVNGVDNIALTKLDHLTRYGKTVKIATGYKLKGKIIKVAPASAAELEKCQPVFETLDLWTEDISGINKFDDLPKNAKKLIQFIEKQLDVPLSYIGTGPSREDLIVRK